MRAKFVKPGPDAVVARIAARQHGVVSIHQRPSAGLTRSGIARRVAAGRLHRVFRGVYAVGHVGLCNEGRWKAAVLGCGEGAVLSDRSAAELWRCWRPVTAQSTSPFRWQAGALAARGFGSIVALRCLQPQSQVATGSR